MKLLLVNIGAREARDLHDNYFLVDTAKCTIEASEKTDLYEYDCLVISSEGIELDCFRWLEQLSKSNKEEGVIMMSPDHSIEHKLKAFEMGVDDYLPMPMHASEIVARIKSVTRRKKFRTNNKLYMGNLVMDLYTRKVQVWDHLLALTKTEYDILLHLNANKQRIVSKEALAEYLWGTDADQLDSFNVLFAHIKNLRRKLLAAKSGVEIKNVYKMGYQIIEI
ncbi:MAG TPA: response regulator transcription factor [Cytophagales bacterium]|nr:response regulator transcription factor [Cytophagales bacterium]